MNLFKSINKTFDLDYKIDYKIKEIMKKYIKKDKNSIEEYENIAIIKSAINEIAKWNIFRLDLSKQLLNKEDLLDLALDEKTLLLDMFNMNQLVERLNIIFTDEQKNLFEYNDQFKRDLMYCAMLRMIQMGGRYKGSEYALIFAKIFNYDYSIAMQYASYDGNSINPKFKKFIEIYLELGGSKNVYWLPNYFDKESRFIMEELESVIYFNESYYEYKKTYKNRKFDY